MAIAMLVFAGVAFVVARLEDFAGEDISGPMRVVDGDTLALGGRRLRLIGIDAPELRQHCTRNGADYQCGLEAAAHLRILVKGSVKCRSEGVDRYRRQLVRCQSDGIDINIAMVSSGHAVAYGDYRLAEAEARSKGIGLWAGAFERPADWRASKSEPDTWSFPDLMTEYAGALWRALKR